MLSTAHRILDNSTDVRLYKSTHKNHPSAKWVRESKNNYLWLYELFIELCKEYTYRYNKVHLSEIKLKDVLKHPPKNISDNIFTPPPQAMPDKYKSNNPIDAYRNYYINEKSKIAKWTNRNVPTWFTLSE